MLASMLFTDRQTLRYKKKLFLYIESVSELGFGIYYLFDSLPTRTGSKTKKNIGCHVQYPPMKINNIFELNKIVIDKVETYLIAVDFEQSAGPVIDYQTKD